MQCIHETVLRDIVDLATDIKDSDEVKRIVNRQNGTSFKSITSKSEALTMVFPVICSKNMSYDSASIVCKAIERKAVTLLQMLFSAAQITDAKDGIDYISRFHSNLNTGSLTVDQFLDAMDNFVEENALLVKESAEYDTYEKIKNDMKSMNFYFENNVSDQSINDYSVVSIGESKMFINNYQPINEEPYTPQLINPQKPNITVPSRVQRLNVFNNVSPEQLFTPHLNPDGTQAHYTTIGLGGTLITDPNRPAYINQQTGAIVYGDDVARMLNDAIRNSNSTEQYERNLLDSLQQLQNSNYYKELDHDQKERFQEIISKQSDRAYELDRQKYETDRRAKDMQNMKNAQDILNIQANIMKNRLVDNDIKKVNELVPTLMYVNFISADDKSSYPIATSMVIGVKAKLYAVDGADIMNRLKIKNNDKNLLLNLIKVSTREISFFRDFLFAIDKAKIDALSQSRRGSSSKLWKVLERRAIRSRLRRALSLKNDATAITTLCITQDEVEFLKKTEYFDVENPKIIRNIMEAYNLMGFAIVDESLEIAKFIFDSGDDIYETITFNNLEREQKDNTKKIINLMSKMNR